MADEKKPEEVKLTDDPAFQQMQSVVTALSRSVKGIADGQQGLTSAVTQLTERGIKMQEVVPPVPDTTDDELESMSQSALAGHLIKEVSKLMDEKVSVLDNKIEQTTTGLAKNMTKEKLEVFAKANPDIIDLADDMRDVLKDNPNLDFQRAYKLVRSELSDERRAELDGKYKVTDETEEGKGDKRVFGGLTPTSDTSDTNENDEQLTADEAGDAAWEELVDDFPQIQDVG